MFLRYRWPLQFSLITRGTAYFLYFSIAIILIKPTDRMLRVLFGGLYNVYKISVNLKLDWVLFDLVVSPPSRQNSSSQTNEPKSSCDSCALPIYRVAQKSKPLLNDKKNRIKSNEWMRLDLFVKLKYQSNYIIGPYYSLVLDILTSLTMPDRKTSDMRHIR